MAWHHMTKEERYKLEAYRTAGKGVAWIARTMGFCRQTIYNELERGAYFHRVDWEDVKRYSADKGQQVHDRNKPAKGPGLKIGNDRAYADFLGTVHISASTIRAKYTKAKKITSSLS